MLEGVRVVELGTTITAPLAAMMLGDLGADVVKVERPEGDPFRAFRGGTYSPHFVAYNRNKRSIVLDLTTDPGRRDLARILETADVLIDNLRPSALARVGLDPAALHDRHPRLIHCSITGFGATGPYRDRPAFDAVAQALSGISSLFLDPRAPDMTGPTISDNVTGMYAAYGILGALVERARTGRGRRLEINMLEASMAFVADAFASVTQLGMTLGPHSRVAASHSFAFRCADGKLFAVHLSSLDKFWRGLLDALELPALADDDRFRTRMDRVAHYLELRALLAAHVATQPRAYWLERLERADVPYASVNDIAEVLDDPQVAALDTMVTLEHSTHGSLQAVRSPLHIDGERLTPDRPPPMLGEHTAELLAERALPTVR